MDARIIPFPGARRPEATGRTVWASGVVPLPADAPAPEPVTEVSLELRRLVHAGSRLRGAAERATRDRCARAAMGSLDAAGGRLRLAGTREHPVIEATFGGENGALRAAQGTLEAGEAVRRAGANEFVVSAAVASGSAVVHDGLRVELGAPGSVADLLRENAAPGQVLLGGPSWGESDRVEVLEARSLEHGERSVPVFVLRDLR